MLRLLYLYLGEETQYIVLLSNTQKIDNKTLINDN